MDLLEDAESNQVNHEKVKSLMIFFFDLHVFLRYQNYEFVYHTCRRRNFMPKILSFGSYLKEIGNMG